MDAHFTYPNYRHGVVCDGLRNAKPSIVIGLVNDIKEESEKHESILDEVVEQGLATMLGGAVGKAHRIRLSGVRVEDYEGKAVHSPTFRYDISVLGDEGKVTYTVILGSTTVVCADEKSSKIWGRISLFSVNGSHSRLGLSFAELNSFFDCFSPIVTRYTHALFELYKARYLEQVSESDHGEVSKCEPLHEVDIKSLGVDWDSRMRSILQSHPEFTIRDFLEHKASKKVVLDYLRFAILQNAKMGKGDSNAVRVIESLGCDRDTLIDDVRGLFDGITMRWISRVGSHRFDEVSSLENPDLIRDGYQLFDLVFSGSSGLFLRFEDLDSTPTRSVFVGLCHDLEKRPEPEVPAIDCKCPNANNTIDFFTAPRMASAGVARNFSIKI